MMTHSTVITHAFQLPSASKGLGVRYVSIGEALPSILREKSTVCEEAAVAD